jgi:YfiH family protein
VPHSVIERHLGRVRAVWTDRHDGVSEPPYDRANLSASSDDATDSVIENRRRLADRLGLGEPGAWWWLRQVHGDGVVVAAGSPSQTRPEADALVTTEAGLPLAVLTADCAPIVLASDTAAGAVHAGWPGLLAGVIESAVARLRALGSGPIRAALGPCIHPAHYEFGRDDLERVVARLGPSVEGRTADGRPALDVPAGVRAALTRAGVEHLDDVDVCTAESNDYFSHRRDGETGRQALVVVLDG